MLYYLVENQLDKPTLALYENTLTPSERPRRYEDLMRFLKQRIQNLSLKNKEPDRHQKPHTKKYYNGYKKEKVTGYSTSLVLASVKPNKAKNPIKPTNAKNTTATKCNSCNDSHPINKCPVFIAMSPNEK